MVAVRLVRVTAYKSCLTASAGPCSSVYFVLLRRLVRVAVQCLTASAGPCSSSVSFDITGGKVQH